MADMSPLNSSAAFDTLQTLRLDPNRDESSQNPSSIYESDNPPASTAGTEHDLGEEPFPHDDNDFPISRAWTEPLLGYEHTSDDSPLSPWTKKTILSLGSPNSHHPIPLEKY